jgi:hypothetical protein
MRYIIEDYECFIDTCYRYLGSEFVKDNRVYLSNLELITKTVTFMITTSFLD